MKKNNFKKTLLAVTLAASIALPTASVAGAAIAANAAPNVPFCADTDGNGAYNIRENLIYVSRSWYEASARSFAVTTDNLSRGKYPTSQGRYIVSNGEIKDLQPLARYVVNIVVYGNDLVESDLKDLNFSLNYKIKGENTSNSVYTSSPASVTPDAANVHKFYVSFEFISKGDSVSFRSSIIRKQNFSINTEASVTATLDNESYYKIEAAPSEGEKLFIKIKYDPSISWNKMESWAKRLCVYANSLSKTTGVKNDTLYMDFHVSGDFYAHCNNDTINNGGDKYGYVGYTEDAANAELIDIATGRNIITWTSLHEMAHSYADGTNSEFRNNYIFFQPEEGDKNAFSFDEYLTNARGLTAIQNCDNLRNTDIHNGNHYEKYNKIAHIVAKDWPDNKMMQVASYLTYLNWDILEAYFAAESDNDTDFAVSEDAARKLNEYMGIEVPITENYLKFVNNFRKLTILKKGAYNEANFRSFLRAAHFKNDFMKELVTELRFYEG